MSEIEKEVVPSSIVRRGKEEDSNILEVERSVKKTSGEALNRKKQKKTKEDHIKYMFTLCVLQRFENDDEQPTSGRV